DLAAPLLPASGPPAESSSPWRDISALQRLMSCRGLESSCTGRCREVGWAEPGRAGLGRWPAGSGGGGLGLAGLLSLDGLEGGAGAGDERSQARGLVGLGDDGVKERLAGDVRAGAAHVQDRIDREEQARAFERQA